MSHAMYALIFIVLALCRASLAKIVECTPHFACDNEFAKCWEGSECLNPNGAPLGGCCVPAGLTMDDGEEEVHQVPKFVEDNCGMDFACDNEIAGCGEGSYCVNPSGVALSGCCVPNGINLDGSPMVLNEGVVSEFVAENCAMHMACDNVIAVCDDHSYCHNPSEGPISGCCVPKGMNWDGTPREDVSESASETNDSTTESSVSAPVTDESVVEEANEIKIAPFVADNCGIEFACDDEIGPCGEGSRCINPTGETLSGCCVPEGLTLDRFSDKTVADLITGELRVAPFVEENCGIAFACDDEIGPCGEGSRCINPTGETLSGCCVPEGLTLDQDTPVFHQYVIENCGVEQACDDVIARCGDDSYCMNPSGDALGGCCIPKDMIKNDISTASEETKETEAKPELPVQPVCGENIGQCIPTVYAANATNLHQEL